MILIIGGSGLIGRSLTEALRAEGMEVLPAYYRHPIKNGIYFDMAGLQVDMLPWEQVATVILAGGITNIDACAADPETSSRVNVEGHRSLIRKAIHWRKQIFFFSSDQVFDGEEAPYRINAPTRPCNRYGQQKKIIEDELLTSAYPNVKILRLGKVVRKNRDDSLLGGWAKKLISNEKIYAFNDVTGSLTDIEMLNCHVIRELKNPSEITKIEHCGLVNSTTREQLAQQLRFVLNASGQIYGISQKALNLKERRPRDSTMIINTREKKNQEKYLRQWVGACQYTR
jgi:dTDP-4-dehydrorhamnose reductase